MKNLLLILFLLLGIVYNAQAQTSKEKVEHFFNKKKTKQFIPMKSHFEKMKKDPAIRHNGTSVDLSNSAGGYKVDGNGFKKAKAKHQKTQKAAKKATQKDQQEFQYRDHEVSGFPLIFFTRKLLVTLGYEKRDIL